MRKLKLEVKRAQLTRVSSSPGTFSSPTSPNLRLGPVRVVDRCSEILKKVAPEYFGAAILISAVFMMGPVSQVRKAEALVRSILLDRY